jgi:hypothetical protein
MITCAGCKSYNENATGEKCREGREFRDLNCPDCKFKDMDLTFHKCLACKTPSRCYKC